MKIILKGLLLGVSLSLLNKVFAVLTPDIFHETGLIISGILFFFVTAAFLISKTIPQLLLCGFCGLFSMFASEFIFMLFLDMKYSQHKLLFSFDLNIWLDTYIYGFFGSMAAIVIAMILTHNKFSLQKIFNPEDNAMNEKTPQQIESVNHIFTGEREAVTISKDLKIKLLIYSVLTAMSFSHFVMPEKVGIGVLVFTFLQFILMWYVAPKKKRLLLFIPQFIMSANYFLSASNTWRTSNFIISAILYACMFMDISFKKDTFVHFKEATARILSPFSYFALPFKWVLELNNKNAPLVKRILVSVVLALPCALILLLMLSSADMVFSLKVEGMFNRIFDIISFRSFMIIVFSIICGLYLFGTLLCAHTKNQYAQHRESVKKGDMILISVLMATILVIYTAFVIIQFKYLFCGATLPNGLIYSQYARKGFFELLALTGINLGIILSVIRFTKGYDGNMLKFIKVLCHYLCAITVILLISSFYRMMLYVESDGLTRLRLFVMGFLIFEAIGLLITFLYIAKPKFNITLIYVVISLCYYSLLNLIPTDNIIAKNQVDLYLAGKNDGIAYVLTLSPDIAPSLEYLLENTNEYHIKASVEKEMSRKLESEIPPRWQRFNYSIKKAEKIFGINNFEKKQLISR